MIEVIGDMVLFGDGIEITDPVLAGMMATQEGAEEQLQLLGDVIEVGARVVKYARDGQQGDMLRREVDRLQETVTRSHRELIDLAGSDFANAVQQVFQQVGEHLASISGRLDGALAVAAKETELAAERERGTAKGRSFEEAVAEELDRIASIQGDTCEHVGDITGASGRAGDVVIGIEGASGPIRGRIVFEAKTGRLSFPEARRELDRAREQRDAAFGVLVVPTTDKLPAGMRMLREYSGDKIVCIFDPDDGALCLELSYSLARARTLMRTSEMEGIDVAAAEAGLERAHAALEDIRRIKGHLTAAKSQIDETYKIIESLASTVREHLSTVATALAS